MLAAFSSLFPTVLAVVGVETSLAVPTQHPVLELGPTAIAFDALAKVSLCVFTLQFRRCLKPGSCCFMVASFASQTTFLAERGAAVWTEVALIYHVARYQSLVAPPTDHWLSHFPGFENAGLETP
jgi:hypothetical protein